MNKSVRDWILTHRQLWTARPDLSYLGGELGSEGVRQLKPAADWYYKFHKIGTNGRFIEDINEQETLQQYALVLRWLPEQAVAWFERGVGFGQASTMEANACATMCPSGIAILYDISMDFILSAMLELWCGVFVLNTLRDDQSFADKLTHTVLSHFFHLCAPRRTVDPRRWCRALLRGPTRPSHVS